MELSLTFKQEVEVEAYLFALQEYYVNPTDEVKQEVLKVQKQLLEFLTEEQIIGLEEYIDKSEPEEPEVIEFSLQLPLGWKAEDFEIVNPETLINQQARVIIFNATIQEKDPGQEEWVRG